MTERKNTNLNMAKKAKQDEFYTQLVDIEKELRHYRKHFKNKAVLCNCDDPKVSNFFHYFSYNFKELGLKRLITTCYQNPQMDLFSKHDSERAIYLEVKGIEGRTPKHKDVIKHNLKGDGDFRSEECIEILKQADIVVTNPPFSLFREYISQLIQYGKKFLIIGNQGVVTYKEVFPLLKDNKMWSGNYAGDMHFKVPAHYEPRKTRYWQDETGQKWRSIGTACWFTNLDIRKRHEELTLYKKYNPKEYPKYDNYDAINVDKIADIPGDYYGVMGVPLTFMYNYNPDQFEIIGLDRYVEDNPNYGHRFKLNGRETYARILIRRKRGKGERKA